MRGDALDDNGLALNLSYVLHEPSTSRHVKQAVRASRRFRRRRNQLLDSFSGLSDAGIADALIVHPELASRIADAGAIDAVITPTVGLPELLNRALSIIQVREVTSELIIIDQANHPSTGGTIELFGHPVTSVVDIRGSSQQRVFVGGLIVRPGERQLQLMGSLINWPDDLVNGATRWLEAMVRDYVDQWAPGHCLWESPIEAVDRSILDTGSSVSAK